MGDHHTYSDQQVKDILMKAVELQQQGTLDAGTTEGGLSKEQLAKMAAELGIDPKYLDAAIDQARVTRQEDKGLTFLGVPLARNHHAVVEGELDPERFDVIVPELGNPGMNSHLGGSQVGRSLTARVSKGMAFGPISVVSRDGKTRIEARQAAFVGFMAGMYPALITSIMVGAGMIGHGHAMAGSLIAGGILAAGFTAFRFMALRGDRSMKEIVSRVAEVVAEETKAQGVRANLAGATAVDVTPPETQQDRA